MRKILAILFLGVLIVSGRAVFAAGNITQDTVTAFTGNTTTQNPSFSHTLSGANSYLVVAIVDGTDAVTSVTYGGGAMTLLKKQADTFGTTGYLYGIATTSTGTFTVQINTSTTDVKTYGAVSYSNAKQTSQPDGSGSTAGGTAATRSVNIITVANGSAGVAIGWDTLATQPAAASGASEISAWSGSNWRATLTQSSTFPIIPAGSYTMANDNVTGIIMVTLAPVNPPASAFNFWQFMPF